MYFQIKISDFGLSVFGDSYKIQDKTKPLPWRYVAPEVFTTDTFDSATDVWAFGVFMYELCVNCLTPPYGTATRKEMQEKFKNGYTFELAPETPIKVAELFGERVFCNHDQRATMTELCKVMEEIFNTPTQPVNKVRVFIHSFLVNLYIPYIPISLLIYSFQMIRDFQQDQPHPPPSPNPNGPPPPPPAVDDYFFNPNGSVDTKDPAVNQPVNPIAPTDLVNATTPQPVDSSPKFKATQSNKFQTKTNKKKSSTPSGLKTKAERKKKT